MWWVFFKKVNKNLNLTSQVSTFELKCLIRGLSRENFLWCRGSMWIRWEEAFFVEFWQWSGLKWVKTRVFTPKINTPVFVHQYNLTNIMYCTPIYHHFFLKNTNGSRQFKLPQIFINASLLQTHAFDYLISITLKSPWIITDCLAA